MATAGVPEMVTSGAVNWPGVPVAVRNEEFAPLKAPVWM